MLSRLETLFTLLSLVLLLPSPTTSQSLWDKPVDFSTTNSWPPESCVRSCLTGNQCTPCNGHSLTTWVGCSTNRCFCTNYATAYFYLYDCMMANCCVGCVTTDPYMLIYNYCLGTGAQDTAAGGGNGGGTTVTTTFTAPSETPTEKPGTNPYAASSSATPSPLPAPQPADTGLTRSDKIALGVGLGVGIPSAIAGIIVIIQFCTGG